MNVTCPNCATIYRVDPAKVPESGVRARCAVCNAVFPVRRDMELARPDARPGPTAASAVSLPTPKVEPPTSQQPRLDPVRQDPPRPEPRPEPKTQPTFTPPPPREPVRAAEPVSDRAPAAAPPSMPPGGPPRPAAPPRPANPFTRPASVPTSGSAGAAPAAPAAPVRPAAPPTPAGVSAPPPVASPKASAAAAPAGRPAGSPGVRPPNPFLSQDPALKAKRLARALISDMVVYHPGKRQEGLRDGNLKELFEEEIKKSWEEYAEQVGREVAESTTYFREALNEILAGGRSIF
jgi:predicted Zn finger-like uncharacterized protein